MKIKWGILGAGAIANKFVSDFKLVKLGEVIAVGSRSLEKAKSFASKFNISNAYGSYQELVSNPDIDIIYIATTHNFHFEHSKLCLQNGKHVLCEKPITVNANQLMELMVLAKHKNLFFMEAMWTPFLPAIKKALDWVQSEKIGEIQIIQANFGFPGTHVERLMKPDLAGGALLDIGIYPLTLIEMFAQSEIIEKSCNASFTNTGVDETITIQLSYKNGVKAQLATTINAKLQNDAYIFGTKGSIKIPDFWMSKSAILRVDGKEEVFEKKTNSIGYNYEIEEVNHDILNGRVENQVMPLARSLKMMHLLDDIRKNIGLKYPIE